MTRPEPGALVSGMETSLGTVTRLAGTADKPIVRLEGVTTRSAAEALRGEPLRAEIEVEEDEFLAEDLVGLAVVDGDEPVGTVDRVVAYPSCEVLSVGDLLIPLVADAVLDVDLDAGVIDVDLGFVNGS